jgi:siroheme synthase
MPGDPAAIARGLPRETPAALVHNVSRTNEKVERTTLGALANRESGAQTAPVVVLIGNAVGSVTGDCATELARASAPALQAVL